MTKTAKAQISFRAQTLAAQKAAWAQTIAEDAAKKSAWIAAKK